jgi:hypothetical protein
VELAIHNGESNATVNRLLMGLVFEREKCSGHCIGLENIFSDKVGQTQPNGAKPDQIEPQRFFGKKVELATLIKNREMGFGGQYATIRRCSAK